MDSRGDPGKARPGIATSRGSGVTHSACSAALIRRYSKLAMDELQAARLSIEADPENRNPNRSSIYIYKPRARSKLEAIAWAITHRLMADRGGAA